MARTHLTSCIVFATTMPDISLIGGLSGPGSMDAAEHIAKLLLGVVLNRWCWMIVRTCD